MKIIISPSKTMDISVQSKQIQSPLFDLESKSIIQKMKSFTINEIQNGFSCSEAIARTTYQYYQDIDSSLQSKAIDAYNGIQYRTLDFNSLNSLEKEYLENCLYIPSAQYGILRIYDTIPYYRLDFLFKSKEMKLYDYWAPIIKKSHLFDDEIVFNLASSEYEQIIKKLIKKENWIDFVFYTNVNNKLKEVSVDVKKARGAMVRYLAIHHIDETNLDKIKEFSFNKYKYQSDCSSNTKFVFVRDKE